MSPARTTQTTEEPAPFNGKAAPEVKQEFEYGGSFASFKPAPSTSNEHFAALANMPIIKEDDSYGCDGPFSIGSSMWRSISSAEEKSLKKGSSVGIQEGWMGVKRRASRSSSSLGSDKESIIWEEKRRRLNDKREVHSSKVAASSTQLLLVEVN